jgi:hypothetical protein
MQLKKGNYNNLGKPVLCLHQSYFLPYTIHIHYSKSQSGHPMVEESRGTDTSSGTRKGNHFGPVGSTVHNGQQVGQTVGEWQGTGQVDVAVGKWRAGQEWLSRDKDIAVNLPLLATQTFPGPAATCLAIYGLTVQEDNKQERHTYQDEKQCVK